MSQEQPRKNLSEEDWNYWHGLEKELIASGGRKFMSDASLGKLWNLSATHAKRKRELFRECGWIEIEQGKGRTPNLIIWKAGKSLAITPLTGLVPLHGPLYLERPEMEECKQYLKLGSYSQEVRTFVRLKAGKGMGKSSLLIRLQHFLETELKQGVGFVDLGSNSFSPDAFDDLNELLYRFTEEVAEAFRRSQTRLNPPSIKGLWRDYRVPGVNCTMYLQEHIFSQIRSPKTLIIDGIDRVIGKEKIQLEFLSLLRTWNETKMKVVSREPIVWPNIVIAYSTEPYLKYGFSVSPLQNVGEVVELKEFDRAEILELSRRYGLDAFSPQDITSIMALIGGHPTLINRAFYKISQEGMSLSELESKATQLNGPFADYLLEYLELLQNDEQLSQCFQQIVKGEICQNQFAKSQLLKAGLIKLDCLEEKVVCELYRRYFTQHL